MDLIEYLKEFITSPSIVLVGAITFIEIVPIKVNPWKWLFSWIGNAINGDIRKDLAELNKELSEMKRDFEQTKAQDKRWSILNFANRCREGKRHTKEEWDHAISELKEYEAYTEEKDITNGVIEANAEFLRERYHQHIINNDFL